MKVLENKVMDNMDKKDTVIDLEKDGDKVVGGASRNGTGSSRNGRDSNSSRNKVLPCPGQSNLTP